MRKNTVDIITLGCSKNLVDSERLIRQLELNGYRVTHDSENPQGEIAVINTCGFIGDAKEESINMILDSKGKADEQCKGMGTTLVALAYYNGVFYSMNCGDSRLYRLRNEELVQLTTDHSLSNMMGNAKHSSIITNCIGGGCISSYIDLVQMEDIQDGDAFLLCSDGLTDMMSDHRLNILLTEGADANDLCNAAIVRGGFDNVSACLIKVKK